MRSAAATAADPVTAAPPAALRRLRDFRDLHAGETIVVCGCGSSLKQLPDPQRLLTIGVNDVGRLFDPTYLVVLNPRNQFKGDRFRHVASSRARTIFTQLNLRLRHPHVVRFRLGQRGGTEISDPDTLPYTRNSPYVALCLAAFMGARRIGLIGVDFTDHHFFAETGRHPLARELKTIDREYRRLASALRRRGVEMVNLSRESRLEALPRFSPEGFLEPRQGPPAVRSPVAATPVRGTKAEGMAPAIGEGQKRLRIVQVAKTHCAGSIWRLREVIDRYTPHSCRTVTLGATTQGRRYPTDLLFGQTAAVRRVLARADVVHFHNFIDADDRLMRPFRRLLAGKRLFLQYHTEPRLVRSAFRGKDVVRRKDLRTLVVAQKQARFYPESLPVPNVLDIHDRNLLPDDSRAYRGGPLKLVYTPTDRKSYSDYRTTCCGKGYSETLPILKRLEEEGLIQLSVLDSLSWEQLMPLKRRHDILIDEVVTGGYHLASLEALSQGLITIASLDRETRQTLHGIVGRQTELPWCRSTIKSLETDLRGLCAMDAAEVNALKAASRRWMEENWDPAEMIQHLLRAYQAPAAQPKKARARRRRSRRPIHVTFKNTRLLPVYHRRPVIHRSLLELQDAWRQRQVVIWGNGPSASNAPEVWQRDAVHVGVNAAWPNLRDAFDAYCVSDQRFAQNPDKRRIAGRAPGVRVYLAHMRDVLPKCRRTNYIRTIGRDGFCSNLKRGAYHGLSVVWVALQLALWGGSRDVLLVGCEHDYLQDGMRCYEEEDPSPVDEGNWPIIRSNYRRLMPVLAREKVDLRTAGPSRLQEAGVPQWE